MLSNMEKRFSIPVVNAAIGLGALLILLGVAFYLVTGQESITALIPSFLGLPLLAVGLLGRQWELRASAVYAATAFALIGFLATVSGLWELLLLIGGAEVARPGAVVEQAITALLCLAFLVLAVRAFLQARRERAAE